MVDYKPYRDFYGIYFKFINNLVRLLSGKRVVSFAKLHTSIPLTTVNQSLMNMLKRKSPKIESCGTPKPPSRRYRIMLKQSFCVLNIPIPLELFLVMNSIC